MEQSKLISGIIAKFKIAYPYYFKTLTTEEVVGMFNMYQSQIVGYKPEIIIGAIDEIIKKSKFMPSIAEILEECESQLKNYSYAISEKMKDDGYFKRGSYGELDKNQELRNYEKATLWLSKKIIPQWLLKDMMAYGYENKFLLPSKDENKKKIGSGKKDVRLLES